MRIGRDARCSAICHAPGAPDGHDPVIGEIREAPPPASRQWPASQLAGHGEGEGFALLARREPQR